MTQSVDEAANEIWTRWFDGTVDTYNRFDPPTISKITGIIHTQRQAAVAELLPLVRAAVAWRERADREFEHFGIAGSDVGWATDEAAALAVAIEALPPELIKLAERVE